MTLLQEIGRKLIHLSSLWMVVFIHMFEKETSILFFGALFVLFFICEYLRMTQPFVISLTNRYFKNIMRAHESVTRFDLRALTGSFYFVLAVFLSIALFEKDVAIAAILIMIVSDTLAAIIGKRFGRIHIWDKTLEGSLTFFATTCIILVSLPMYLTYWQILVIAFLVSIVELVSNKVAITNDNLTITLSAGLLISLLGF